MDINVKVGDYLKERFGPETLLISMERLGEGVHGTAYRVRFKDAQGENRLIMKTLFHSRFGHDHYSDRAQVLLLAQANFNEMPKHVRATDVVGESPDRLIFVKDAREFYIFYGGGQRAVHHDSGCAIPCPNPWLCGDKPFHSR